LNERLPQESLQPFNLHPETNNSRRPMLTVPGENLNDPEKN
jgi:hypothetical protein